MRANDARLECFALEHKGDVLYDDVLMDDGQSALAQPGDTWAIMVGGEVRYAKVIAPGDAPGWWQCREVKTGIEFSAWQEWLTVRLDPGGD